MSSEDFREKEDSGTLIDRLHPSFAGTKMSHAKETTRQKAFFELVEQQQHIPSL